MNTINHETCKGCNLCTEVCPAHIITPANGSPANFVKDRLHLCVKCGQCMAICSSQSISIPGLSYENEVFTLKENHVDYDTFHNFLTHRRSVRVFSPMPVSNMVIEKIIHSIALAPYGADCDCVSITVINDRKTIEKALPYMSEFFKNIKKWLANPFIRFMMKRRVSAGTFNTLKDHILPMIKLKHYELDNGADNITRHAPVLIIFHAKKGAPEALEDAHIKLTYALLAAHSLGLGATAIGLVPPAVNKDERVREIFQIPKTDEALSSLILGYPKYHIKKGVIHNNFKVNYITHDIVD